MFRYAGERAADSDRRPGRLDGSRTELGRLPSFYARLTIARVRHSLAHLRQELAELYIASLRLACRSNDSNPRPRAWSRRQAQARQPQLAALRH
jgi:hypothetical protein